MHLPVIHWNPRHSYYMHMTGFTRLSLALVLQATKISGQGKELHEIYPVHYDASYIASSTH